MLDGREDNDSELMIAIFFFFQLTCSQIRFEHDSNIFWAADQESLTFRLVFMSKCCVISYNVESTRSHTTLLKYCNPYTLYDRCEYKVRRYIYK